MSPREPDAVLRRLERTALAFCAGAAVVALGVRRLDPDVALGILAGGLLTGTSYRAIKRGVDGLVGALPTGAAAGDSGGRGAAARGAGWAGVVLRFVGRYALLALIAYVMIARFRLHPVGLLIGVSSVVVAASLEAIRAVSGPGSAARPGSPGAPR